MIVKQADNVLSLLELFAHMQRPMTLTQISQEIGLPKSSTHNLIETLAARGYLYEVRQRGGFYLSRKPLRVARLIAEGDQVTTLISDLLEKLVFDTGETALLSARAGDYVIYLSVTESRRPIRYFASPGDKRPVYATSGGKAILSTYDDDRLDDEITNISFTDATENTIKSGKALKKNILQGRERGYFLNLSEYTPEVTGVGIPILVDGRRMGLSLAGPNYRTVNRLDELADHLRRAEQEIERTLKEAGLGLAVGN